MSDRALGRIEFPIRWACPPFTRDLFIVTLMVGFATFCGMELAQQAGRIPTIWPANGLLLAVLLSARPARWPVLILVGFLANLCGALFSAFPLFTCMRLALVNSFEVTLALYLIRRLVGLNCDLSQPRSLWRFAVSAAVVPAALAVLFNAALSSLTGDPRSVPIFVGAFFAHALGIITVTPAALAVRRRASLPSLDRRRAKDMLMVFALLLSVTVIVFTQSRYPLLFLILPPLVFVVFRSGFVGGALGLFFATLVSIGLTITGHGPAATIIDSTIIERIIIVQLFSSTAAGLVLTLSAVLAERDRVQQELVDAKEALTRLAATDSLTGIANRRRFDEAFEEECRRALRQKLPISLLLIDVDRFKVFNDRYGHLDGDAALRAVASAIDSKAQRPGDVVARYGGEEIAVILPATDENGALVVAEAVRGAVMALAMPHEGNEACGGIVTVSIGIATASDQGFDYSTGAMIRFADELLYEAKRTGRNKVLSSVGRSIAPVPDTLADEALRLRAAEPYEALADGRRYPELDAIAKQAADLLHSPIGLVSIVGRDQQVFVGRHGFDVEGTGRDVSFCAHAITADDPLVVLDATTDLRFAENALVTGDTHIRFYAGAPLVTPEGAHHIGAVCVIDRVTHTQPDRTQRQELTELAAAAMRMLDSIALGDAPQS